MQVIRRQEHPQMVQAPGHMVGMHVPAPMRYVDGNGQLVHPQMIAPYQQEQCLPIQGRPPPPQGSQLQAGGDPRMLSLQSPSQQEYALQHSMPPQMLISPQALGHHGTTPACLPQRHFYPEAEPSSSPSPHMEPGGPRSQCDPRSFYRRFKRMNNESAAASSRNDLSQLVAQPRRPRTGAFDFAEAGEPAQHAHAIGNHTGRKAASPGTQEGESSLATRFTGAQSMHGLAQALLNHNVHETSDQGNHRQASGDADSNSRNSIHQNSQIQKQSVYNGQIQKFNLTNNSNLNYSYQDARPQSQGTGDKDNSSTQKRQYHQASLSHSAYQNQYPADAKAYEQCINSQSQMRSSFSQLHQSEMVNSSQTGPQQTSYVLSSNSFDQSHQPQVQKFQDQFITAGSIDSAGNAIMPMMRQSFTDYGDPQLTNASHLQQQPQLKLSQQPFKHNQSILVKKANSNTGDRSTSQSPSGNWIQSSSMYSQQPSLQVNAGVSQQQPQYANLILQSRSVSDNNYQRVAHDQAHQQTQPRYQEESTQHANMTPNHQQLNRFSQQSIGDQNSMISYSPYSANKQVRFKHNTSSEELLGYDGRQLNARSHNATDLARCQHAGDLQYYQRLTESQETSKVIRKGSILTKRDATTPKSKNQARSASRSKKRDGQSAHSKKSKLDGDASIRSRSNKSRLSRRSSAASCRSIHQRSSKKSRYKRSQSVNQQQIDEYNKFSAKKKIKAADSGVQVIALKGVRASASQTRGGESSAKKKRSVSRPKDANPKHTRRFQTILIETDGLSPHQINQIDRVSRILNNERLCKSPAGKSQRSSKKREASARKRGQGTKLTIGSSSPFNSLSSKRPTSKHHERGQEALDRSLSQTQYPGDEALNMQDAQAAGLVDLQMNAEARRKHIRQGHLIHSQQVQPSSVQNMPNHVSNHIQPPHGNIGDSAQIHLQEQNSQRPVQSSQNQIEGYHLQPLHPVASGPNGGSGQNTQVFPAMYEYASPKYTIDYPPSSSFGIHATQTDPVHNVQGQSRQMNQQLSPQQLHLRMPNAQSQQQIVNQSKQVCVSDTGQQQLSMAAGPRGYHHHGQSMEPIGTSQDPQQQVLLAQPLDTLHTIQGSYLGLSNPTQFTQSTLQYHHTNHHIQTGNGTTKIYQTQQRDSGQENGEPHMILAQHPLYLPTSPQGVYQGIQADRQQVVSRSEEKASSYLDTRHEAEEPADNKTIDQLDQLSQKMRHQDFHQSSQKSIGRFKSYNNDDINDVVDQISDQKDEEKQMLAEDQNQNFINHAKNWANEANTATILTSTTHITHLTQQPQNQMNSKFNENRDENQQFEETAQIRTGDHISNNDQENQDEDRGRNEEQEHEVAGQKQPEFERKVPFCSGSNTKMGNSQAASHHATPLAPNDAEVAQNAVMYDGHEVAAQMIDQDQLEADNGPDLYSPNQIADQILHHEGRDLLQARQGKAPRNGQTTKFISFNDSRGLNGQLAGCLSLQRRTLENQESSKAGSGNGVRSPAGIQFIPADMRARTAFEPQPHMGAQNHENDPQSLLWANQPMPIMNSLDYPHEGPQSSYFQMTASNIPYVDAQMQAHQLNSTHGYRHHMLPPTIDGARSHAHTTARYSRATSPQNTIQQYNMLNDSVALRNNQMYNGYQTAIGDGSGPFYAWMDQTHQQMPNDDRFPKLKSQFKEKRSKSMRPVKVRPKSKDSEDASEPRTIAIRVMQKPKSKVRKPNERSPSAYSQKSVKSKISQISKRKLSKKRNRGRLTIDQQTLSTNYPNEIKSKKSKDNLQQRSPSIISKNSKISKMSAKKVKKSAKKGQESKKKEPRSSKSVDAFQIGKVKQTLIDLHHFYLDGIRQVYDDIAQAQERSAALGNQGKPDFQDCTSTPYRDQRTQKEVKREAIMVGDHLQADSRMSAQKFSPACMNTSHTAFEDTEALIQGSLSGIAQQQSSAGGSLHYPHPSSVITFAKINGVPRQDSNLMHQAPSMSMCRQHSSVIGLMNDTEQKRSSPIAINDEANSITMNVPQPSHLMHIQEEHDQHYAEYQHVHQPESPRQIQDQAASRLSKSQEGLVQNEGVNTEGAFEASQQKRHSRQSERQPAEMNEKNIESHAGCKIDHSTSRQASAKKENDVDNEQETMVSSQLIFNPGTNQFYRQVSDGTLIPVSDLNVQVLCDGAQADLQFQKQQSKRQSQNSLASSHRPTQKGGSALLHQHLETPGFHESNGKMNGSHMQRSQEEGDQGSRILLSWQQSNQIVGNEVLRQSANAVEMHQEAAQNIPRELGPFQNPSRASVNSSYQNAFIAKQSQEQIPCHHCQFQNLEPYNQITDIQLETQKFDNSFHQQEMKYRSAKPTQGSRDLTRSRSSCPFKGQNSQIRTSRTPQPLDRSKRSSQQQFILENGSIAAALPDDANRRIRSKSTFNKASKDRNSFRYLKSIDRIVKDNRIAGVNPKKCRQRQQSGGNHASTELRKGKSRSGHGRSTVSALSVKLPKRRLIVSPVKQKSKKSKSRARARTGMNKSDLCITPKPMTAKRISRRRSQYRRQQETVERLHSQGQKDRSNWVSLKDRANQLAGRRSLAHLRGSWDGAADNQAGQYAKVNQSNVSAKRRCNTAFSGRPSSSCGNAGCMWAMHVAKDSIRKGERAKYDQDLQLQKRENATTVKGLNRQWRTRLEFLKNQIHSEKTRAQRYGEAIKEMTGKIDKVGQKSSALYQKTRSHKKHTRGASRGPPRQQCGHDYGQARRDGPIRDIKTVQPMGGPNQGDNQPHITIQSNPWYSQKLCTSSESAISRSAHDIAASVQDGRTECNHKKIQSHRSKNSKNSATHARSHSKKSANDLKRDTSAGQSKPFTVDKSVNQYSIKAAEGRTERNSKLKDGSGISVMAYGTSEDRGRYCRESNRGKYSHNQPSTLDGPARGNVSGRGKLDCRDEPAGLSNWIDIQKSAMLEPSIANTIEQLPPNYSLLPSNTNRRDSTRSSGRSYGKHQTKSQIIVGGQKLTFTHQPSRGDITKCISKNPSHIFTQINKQASSEEFTMTQTSSQLSEVPSVNFYSLSNKIMQNNKEIRRIEKILYKDENKAAKYKKPKNLLSQTNQNVQIFAAKIRELRDKQTQTRNSNRDSRRSYNFKSGPVPALIDEISLQKLRKIEKFDKESTRGSKKLSACECSRATLSYKQI